MSDILRERVVAEMMASVGCETIDNTEWRAYCLMAAAAIALIRPAVLEEAASVADTYATKDWPLGEWFRNTAALELAAAIRALKDRP